MTDSPASEHSYSPIVSLAMGLSKATRRLTLRWYLRKRLPSLRDRAEIPESEAVDEAATRKHARAVDFYVLTWLVSEIAVFAIVAAADANMFRSVALVPVVSRIVELLRTTFNTVLLDRRSGRADNRVAIPERLVILAIVNYLELALCFATIYSISLANLVQPENLPTATSIDALYFSFLTQVTISFGDPVPIGGLRYVAAFQGIAGLFFIALVVGRTIGSQPAFVSVLAADRSGSAQAAKQALLQTRW